MEFLNKVVVISGASQGIGKSIKEEFEKNGARVYNIDIQDNASFQGDISNEKVLEKFANYVLKREGKIDYLINNAAPLFKGINECSYEEFVYALKVGVAAPFYLTKLFLKHFNKEAVVINISSSRDRMSQPQSESYSAAKGGIAALTHSLAVSLKGIARVNSISPGWIDNSRSDIKGVDASQHLVNRVGDPLDIANMTLFLCSKKGSFIDGENICIDGGMTRLMIYHGENGWEYSE